MKPDYEYELFTLIRIYGLPEPVREYCAVEGRKFRWDFAWPERKLLVEIQGDIWAGRRGEQSGHTSGTGLTRDYEKNNLAVMAGWQVLFFAGAMIKDGTAIECLQKYFEGAK